MNDDAARLLCGTPELPARCVALTFDDGPGPRSAELARLLREENVPGTFFVLGESVRRYGHVLDSYRDLGHVIGLPARLDGTRRHGTGRSLIATGRRCRHASMPSPASPRGLSHPSRRRRLPR